MTNPPLQSRASWLRFIPDGGRQILANATSMALSTVITSGLGFVYWVVAARGFSTSVVGLGSAAISAMTLVATISALGLGTYVLGEAQRDKARVVALVVAAVVAASLVALFGGAAYVIVSGHVSTQLRPLSGSLGSILIFAIGCLLLAGTTVLDQALVGAMRGSWQLARNLLFGASKLVLLVVFIAASLTTTSDLLLTWVLGMVLSLMVLWAPLRRRGRDAIDAMRPRRLTRHLPEVWRVVVGHQVLNIALKLPILILPVLVVIVLSPQDNASFYVAWMIANVAFVLPGALATVLYSISARDTGALAQKLRYTLSLSVVISIVAGIGMVVLAVPVLKLFGSEYATAARSSLLVLAVSGVPVSLKNHYVAVRRATGNIPRALPVVWAGAALEIVFALLGGRAIGLVGISAGWLIAVIFEAVIMLPVLVRAWSGRQHV